MKIALVATIVIGLLMTLSPNIGVLLGLRLLEGAALGGVPALAITYLNEEVSRKSAVIVAGTYVSGTALGGLIGRVLAGPLAELVDWRSDPQKSAWSAATSRRDSRPAPAKKPGGKQIPNLSPGDRVTHDSFGLGTVVSVDGMAEKTKVKVDFGSSGEKTLLLNYANLDKL